MQKRKNLDLFKYILFIFLIFISAIANAINIKIEGNQHADESVILSLIDKNPVNISDEYSNYLLKKLNDSELFKNVEVKVLNDEYIVTILEYPRIKAIYFENNERLKDEDLLNIASELKLENFSDNNIDLYTTEVSKIYKSFGYNNIEIDYKSDLDLSDNTATLYFEINEGKITKINNVIFNGNNYLEDDLILSVIKSKNKSLKNIFANNNYKLYQVENDLLKIKKLYQTNGFKDVSIKFKIEYFKNNKVNIIFDIKEGDQYFLSSFEINNNLSDNNKIDLALEDFIIKNEKFQDSLYDVDLIENYEIKIANILENNGALFFEIQTFEKITNQKVDLLYKIIETKKKYINQINITGNSRTFDYVIRREFKLNEGDAYNESHIKYFQKRINRLNYFQSFEVTEEDISDDFKNINIEVKEKQTGTFNVGFSFGSLDGVSFVTGLNEKNFGGTGRSLDFLLSTTDKSNKFTFDTTDRFLFNDQMDLRYGVSYTEYDFSKASSYQLDELSFGSGLAYYLSKNLYHNIDLNYEIKDYYVTNSEKVSTSILNSSGVNVNFNLSNKLTYSTLNSFMMPTKGNHIEYINNIESPTSSTNGYFKNTIVLRKFLKIDKNIYSIQSKIGNIISINDNEITSDNKYSLGGRWLRGFDLYGAGPRKSRTSYIGGKNLFALKLDYSRPLTSSSDSPIYFNVFNDYGAVWDNKTKPTHNDNDLRSSYGFGIKYYSPIGPIGFSWGFPILDKEYDIKRMFLFSIGNID